MRPAFIVALFSSLLFVTVSTVASLMIGGELWRRAIASQVAVLLRADAVSGAAQYLKNGSILPWWLRVAPPPLFSVNADTGLASADISEWRSDAQIRVERLVESQAQSDQESLKFEQMRAEQRSIEQSITRLNSRYQLLAAGASELFHLELASDAPTFYTAGLLSGLPTLKDLPDGINTLPDLSAAITRAGGVVVNNAFAASLSNLVTEGKELQTALSASETALQQVAQAQTDFKRAKAAQGLKDQVRLSDYFAREAARFFTLGQ